MNAADGEAVNSSPFNDVFAGAVITRRSVSSAIVRMQMTATLAADGETLQQCGALSHRATCLVRLGMNIGVDAGLISLISCPVDEALVVIGKKHRPFGLR